MTTVPFPPSRPATRQSATAGRSDLKSHSDVSSNGRNVDFQIQEPADAEPIVSKSEDFECDLASLAIVCGANLPESSLIFARLPHKTNSPASIDSNSIDSKSKTRLIDGMPVEVIAAIFSWIAPPAQVHQYRALCRSINDALSDPYFHQLNVLKFYQNLGPLEKVVKISYVVFPDLETIKSVWEIVLHDHCPEMYGDKLVISVRSKDHGILPVASKMVERLDLPFPIEHVNATRLMRYNRENGVVRKLFERGVDRQGPSPFDAENEVLVFWNPALPYLPLPETLQIFVPAYTAASSKYEILRGIRKEYVSKRIHIPFSMFPSLSWNWSVVEDGYAMADGRVDIYCFMLMLDKFMDDQGLVNVIVRRQLMQSDAVTTTSATSATSIFSQDMNGNLTPLDFTKERIVLYPIGLYDGFAPPESLKEWNLIQQKATELAAENSFDEAANLFRKLIVSKLDVYGVKAPQTYENHVDIAAIRFAEHNLQQASKELRIFFENGPQRSKQLLKTAFDLMRQIAIMGDCPGLVGPFTAEHSKRGGKFAKSYNGLFSVYSKTGLFSRDVAVPVNRETATSIECVNSFFISGMFLHQQGRYEEALKRYGTALERRQLLFPDQLVALQTIRNHMQVTRLALCKRLMARGDYHAAYPVSKSYYEVSMENLSWLAEPSTEAYDMVKQCEKELGII